MNDRAPSEHDPIEPIRSARVDSRPFVVAQLGQSLDGRIATLSGESRWINRDAALDHLHRLRAAVDAVVVGVGTVITDDPRLDVRRVAGRSPTRVVIDPRGRLPATARCQANDGSRRIIVTGERAHVRECEDAGAEIVRLPDAAGRLAPSEVVAALYSRGLKRILIEGGAWTVSAFIDAGVIDRLHVLVAPMILGSGKPGLSLAPIARLADAARPPTRVHVLADGDVLFDCDLSNTRRGG